jgi:hypothetical protein
MSWLYFVVQNEDKQPVSQIKRVNAACKLLALFNSDDQDLQAANAWSHFLCILSLGGQSVGAHAFVSVR